MKNTTNNDALFLMRSCSHRFHGNRHIATHKLNDYCNPMAHVPRVKALCMGWVTAKLVAGLEPAADVALLHGTVILSTTNCIIMCSVHSCVAIYMYLVDSLASHSSCSHAMI